MKMPTDKPIIDIEDWAVVESVSGNAWRPLEPGHRLTGHVSAHDRLPSGIVFTSVIDQADEAKGLVETQNSVYCLGRIHDGYARWREHNETHRAA